MTMEYEHAWKTIQTFLQRREWGELNSALMQMQVQDIAALMPELEPGSRVLVFRFLPRSRSAEVFSYLAPEHQDQMLQDLTNEETRHLLTTLPPDDRTALLQELPAEVMQRLLGLLPPDQLRQARELLGYPPESVGRLMVPSYVSVRPDWTVAQTLEHMRSRPEKKEVLHVIYVTDQRGKLLDSLDLRSLVLEPPEKPVSAIMEGHVTSVVASADREEAVQLIRHYDLNALPVVDSDGVLLGTVTVDDVMDVAEEEATEDFHKMATVTDFTGSVRDASALTLYQKRVSWLVVLVFANIFTGIGIAFYEATIEAVVALVFFLPLIVASGGNAGAQASTLMIRALATGDARLSDWHRLLRKELAVASALGVTMGATIAGIGYLRGGFDLGLVVALSMILVVIAGSVIGMLLPFIFNRMRLDPSAASAPLVTSLADIFGVLIYFSIATAILTF